MGRERLGRYSLTGPENRAAVEAGLAGGLWFRSAVPRTRMKELMRRSDYPAVRDTAIRLGLSGLFAGVGQGGDIDPEDVIAFEHEGNDYGRSTGRRTTSTTPPTATARTRRRCCATAWSWAASSNAPGTTGASTTPAARRSARRCW